MDGRRLLLKSFILREKLWRLPSIRTNRLLLKAPLGSDSEEVVRRLRRRAGWIYRQMLYFEQFEPKTPPRRHVSGESHLYLGRKYRLKIRKSQTPQVLLRSGYFHIHSPNLSPDYIQKLLEEWYLQKASNLLPSRLSSGLGKVQKKRRCQAKPENTKNEGAVGKPVNKRPVDAQSGFDQSPERMH